MVTLRHSIECWILCRQADGEIQVLLLRVAAGSDHPSFLQPVTGGIEEGEDARSACLREIDEETGLRIGAKELVRIPGYTDVEIGPKSIIRKRLFACRVGPELPDVRISDEHEGFEWVPDRLVPEALHWESNRETFQQVQSRLSAPEGQVWIN